MADKDPKEDKPQISPTEEPSGANGESGASPDQGETKDATSKVHIPDPNTDTLRIDLGDTSPNQSDTSRIDLGDTSPNQSDTSRIDITDAKIPDIDSENEIRIDLNTVEPVKAETDRIDLSAAYPADIDEAEDVTSVTLDPSALGPGADRIDLARPLTTEPDADSTSPKVPSEEVKREIMMASTVPIDPVDETHDLQEAGVPAKEDVMMASTVPIDPVDETHDLQEAGVPGKEAVMMASTVPIDPVDANADVVQPDASKEASVTRQIDAMKNQTMRVVLEDDGAPSKGDTSRLDDIAATTPASPVSSESAGTARVDLHESSDSDDVFKRAAASETATNLAGVKAKRPVTSKKPPAKSPPKRETARIEVSPPAKSSTARIEVTSDDVPQAPPRPKGIKLKRAEGGGKKPAASGSSLQPAGTQKVAPDKEDGGLLTGVMGILTLLVMGTLVYVLAAQSIAPDLPFPGKL